MSVHGFATTNYTVFFFSLLLFCVQCVASEIDFNNIAISACSCDKVSLNECRPDNEFRTCKGECPSDIDSPQDTLDSSTESRDDLDQYFVGLHRQLRQLQDERRDLDTELQSTTE